MNVITSAPMFVNRKAANVGPSELYYGLDGSSSADEILKFQYWMEANHDNVKYGQLRTWDSDTANAWKLYGKAYKKDSNKPVVPASMLGRGPVVGASAKQKSDWANTALGAFNKSGQNQPTVLPTPEKEPMKKGTKIAIIAGAILVAGIGVYLIARSRASKGKG